MPSKRSPSGIFFSQSFLPVFRSICWTWLHLARSVTPLMYAMATLSSSDFCTLAPQIFCGSLIVGQLGLPSEMLYATSSL